MRITRGLMNLGVCDNPMIKDRKDLIINLEVKLSYAWTRSKGVFVGVLGFHTHTNKGECKIKAWLHITKRKRKNQREEL